MMSLVENLQTAFSSIAARTSVEFIVGDSAADSGGDANDADAILFFCITSY